MLEFDPDDLVPRVALAKIWFVTTSTGLIGCQLS